MQYTKRTIKGKIRYSNDALVRVKNIVSEDQGRLKGKLELELNGEWLFIKFYGRGKISSELEQYIERVNLDGTRETMRTISKLGGKDNG